MTNVFLNTEAKARIKQPPVLFDRTQAIIRELEEKTGIQTLIYWNSSRGNICNNDAVALYEIFKQIEPGKKVALFIKSSGGNGEAS